MREHDFQLIISDFVTCYNRIGKSRKETLDYVLKFLGVAYIGRCLEHDVYKALLDYLDISLDLFVWR